MKKKEEEQIIVKFFKNKTQMVIYLLLIALFIAGFIYFGTRDYSDVNKKKEKTETKQNETMLNNMYKYVTAQDAKTLVQGEDVIILFGIKNNDFVAKYADILEDAAREVGIEQIYYYDMTKDRAEENDTYESIVAYLDNYVTRLDSGKVDIYGPTLLIKKGGVIMYFDDESAFIKGNLTAEEYFTDYEANTIRLNLTAALKDFVELEGEK